jgi:tetratricopeptide (TPR) repeat protein
MDKLSSMIKFKMTITIVLFSLLACSQKSGKHAINPAAVKLNNQAMELFSYIANKDSATKMIKLLDSATAMDSDYFTGYFNKQIVLNQLKQYEKSIVAVQNLIRLRPNACDLYLNGGILYEITGDTVSSRLYFQKSLAICKSVLDTMNMSNPNYDVLATNMALNLIMLGQQKDGNAVLEKVYKSQTDSSLKGLTQSFMNKSKREIIDMVANPVTQDSQSTEANVDN